ncbi:MAG: YopX family protein [Candidatus Woesearchaeota archaeon]|jgi:uncharacterized phage protein (TIGR01671 family)
MKEIKYRQPIYHSGKFGGWHYWGYIHGGLHTFTTPLTSNDGEIRESHEYIGHKDKNKQEIYAGDILKIKNERPDETKSGKFVYKYRYAKVIWYFDGYKAELANGNKWDNEYSYEDWSDEIDWKETKVVGNIIETPELLK